MVHTIKIVLFCVIFVATMMSGCIDNEKPLSQDIIGKSPQGYDVSELRIIGLTYDGATYSGFVVWDGKNYQINELSYYDDINHKHITIYGYIDNCTRIESDKYLDFDSMKLYHNNDYTDKKIIRRVIESARKPTQFQSALLGI